MRKYELVIIFAPTTDEETRNSIFDRLKGIIESAGSVDSVDEWGTRKLAYEIKDFTEGYYIVANFQAETEAVNELDRIAKITDQVIRHMVVREEE